MTQSPETVTCRMCRETFPDMDRAADHLWDEHTLMDDIMNEVLTRNRSG
jgi:hypothetical protein